MNTRSVYPPGSLAGSSSDDYEEDEHFLNDNSSTSTAGPPTDSPNRTSCFTRPSWSRRTFGLDSSRGDSPSSPSHGRGPHGNATGSFPAFSGGPQNTGSFAARGAHQRTVSSSSVSASPNGSNINRPWARSFRLFNISRYNPVSHSSSRQRDGSVSNNLFKSAMLNNMNSRGSAALNDNERSPHLGHATRNLHQRQSSIFSSFSGYNGATHHMNTSRKSSPELKLSTTGTYAAAQQNPSVAMPMSLSTPLLPPSQSFHGSVGPNASFFMFSTKPQGNSYYSALVNYAMGGGQMLLSSLSPVQRELDMMFRHLSSYIAINGKTIIVGDKQHPLEIKRGPLLGTGGFAKVYVGLNTIQGEIVAIKEVDIEGVTDVKLLNTIEQEFALLRALQHPNIISYHFFEHSKSQKVCRIVMEVLAADSTLNLLHKYGRLTETILRKLTRSLLSAISFIHKEGIFHRDIKPANILISHLGEVKLCDFGGSKRVSELNREASCIIGTPVYMAPEFIKGEVSYKSDIWSVGCSLFELATGLLPWYHSGVKDNLPLMFYITTTSETPLVLPSEESLSELSPEFINFLELCFTRDVTRRPDANALLKHPWLSEQRTSTTWTPQHTRPSSLSLRSESPASQKYSAWMSKHSECESPQESMDDDEASFSNDEHEHSFAATDTLNSIHADDEAICQQELEEVAAAITMDRCHALLGINASESYGGDRKNAEDITDTSPIHTHTISNPSYSQSHRPGPASTSGELPSVATSATSVLNENFSYNQVQLGASAGTFVLPNDSLESAQQQQQQYLRINEQGNLDFATLPADDFDSSVGDALLAKSSSVDSNAVIVSRSSRVISPGRNSSFSRSSLSPLAHHAGGPHDHPVSPYHPPQEHTAPRDDLRSAPPGISLETPPPPPAPPSSAPPATRSASSPPQLTDAQISVAGSTISSPHDGAVAHSPLSTSSQQSGSFRQLPDKVRPQADGKLHMSFAVSTAPGAEVNVELNVNVSDVHCRVVDNRPNYVIALSDDIRDQITSKIKEVAAYSEVSSPLHSAVSRTISPNEALGAASPFSISHYREAPGLRFVSTSSQTSTTRSPGVPPPPRSAVNNISQFEARLGALADRTSAYPSVDEQSHSTSRSSTPAADFATIGTLPYRGNLYSDDSPQPK